MPAATTDSSDSTRLRLTFVNMNLFDMDQFHLLKSIFYPELRLRRLTLGQSVVGAEPCGAGGSNVTDVLQTGVSAQ